MNITMIGRERRDGRSLATAIVFGLGIAALLLMA